MSDIQHAASRSRRASRQSPPGTAGRSSRTAPAAESGHGQAAPHNSCPAASRGSSSRIASGMRCMNQPSRSPLALNTTRRAPVARSTRRSTTAAYGRSSMRRRGTPGQPLERTATGGGDHRGQVARLLAADRVMMHHLQRIAGLRHVDACQRPPRAAHQIQIAIRRLQPAMARSRGPPRRSRGRGPDRRRRAPPVGSRQGCSVCDTPRAPRSRRTNSSEPPPISARMPSAVGMPHSTPSAEYSASC